MEIKKLGAFAAVVLALVGVLACAERKHEVRLEMTREVVVKEPILTGIQVEPAGQIDTRNGGRDVKVTITGDPDLQATLDAGSIKKVPMRQKSPGVYEGSFKVTQGQTGNVKIVGTLLHPPSGARVTREAASSLTLFESDPDPVSITAPVAEIRRNPCQELDGRIAGTVVLFPFDQALLDADAKGLLDATKDALLEAPECRVFVLGHTDTIGEDTYNNRLSQHRADNVVDYLVRSGIPAERFQPLGMGHQHPLVVGKGKAEQAPNRRTEVRATNPYGE